MKSNSKGGSTNTRLVCTVPTSMCKQTASMKKEDVAAGYGSKCFDRMYHDSTIRLKIHCYKDTFSAYV